LATALGVNVLLLGLFAAQHSVMARRGFKRWWTKIVPPVVERSTYVLFATLALVLILWQWRPIPQPVFWLGWAILFVATFLLNHFELFGLSQIFSRAAGHPIADPEFRTPALYRY